MMTNGYQPKLLVVMHKILRDDCLYPQILLSFFNGSKYDMHIPIIGIAL